MSLHPVIQIVSFLILAAFISMGSHPAFLVALSVVLFFYLRAGVAERATVRLSLWRMRWLFLSIELIYLFTALDHPLGGFVEGARRVIGLVGVAALAVLLINVTPKAELASAIYHLTGWLRFMGISRDRLAVRLIMVLETVPAMQELLAGRFPKARFRTRRPKELGQAVGALMASVLEEAKGTDLKPIPLAEIGRPPAIQWFYPTGLMLLFIGVQAGL